MSPSSFAEKVSVLERFVKLPQFAILEMETLVGMKQARLWQSITNGREIIAPHARSFLSLEEGRFHEEMTTNCCDKVGSQALHQVNATVFVVMAGVFEVGAEFCNIPELCRGEGWLTSC